MFLDPIKIQISKFFLFKFDGTNAICTHINIYGHTVAVLYGGTKGTISSRYSRNLLNCGHNTDNLKEKVMRNLR